jgi:spermidine synthase
MDGTALAREYLRAMAAMTVAHAMMGQSSSKREKDAMLMIGLGSGALPFFMETHFKNVFEMETVEHDPVVVEAIERTCFNNKKIPFRCVIDDAREYLETKIAKDKDEMTTSIRWSRKHMPIFAPNATSTNEPH